MDEIFTFKNLAYALLFAAVILILTSFIALRQSKRAETSQQKARFWRDFCFLVAAAFVLMVAAALTWLLGWWGSLGIAFIIPVVAFMQLLMRKNKEDPRE